MNENIYIKFPAGATPPTGQKVKIEYIAHAKDINGYLIIQSKDTQVWLCLFGNAANLVNWLRDAAQEIENQTWSQSQRQQMQPANSQHFNLVTLQDIAPEIPIAQKLALLIERFEPTLPDIAECLRRDYKNFIGIEYGEKPDRQLESDLEQLRPILTELTENGQLIRGAKTRIAQALGLPNGGSSYQRIQAIAQAVQEQAA